MNVGADAINAQKVENLSDSARMMNTFGNSITGAINSLNETEQLILNEINQIKQYMKNKV